MYFVSKILILYILLHGATASLYLFLSRGMSIEWTKQISSLAHVFQSEVHNDNFKTFSDIYIDGNSHKLALLWHYEMRNKFPSTSNLTIRVHYFDGRVNTKTCNIIPPSRTNKNRKVSAEKIVFLKSDRLLVSWKVVHKLKGERTLFKVISIDNCDTSKLIKSVVATNLTHNIGRKFYKVIQLESSFDIIFENFEICPKGYCRLSFDYNGKPLSRNVKPFLNQFIEENETIFINSIDTTKSDSGTGVVLTGNKNQSPTNGRVIVRDIYSPVLGWTNAKNLSSDYVRISDSQAYSNNSGFATLCWMQQFENKLSCKWLDGSHKNNNRSGNVLTVTMERKVSMPHIYNTPDGQIIMMAVGSENNDTFIFVDKLTTHGKCERLIKIFNRNSSYPQSYLLSITSQNQLCFSFIMWRSNAHIKNNIIDSYTYTYEFITQCIEVPKNFTADNIKCGENYV